VINLCPPIINIYFKKKVRDKLSSNKLNIDDDKLGSELFPAVDKLGSDKIEADISVADGEVFSTAPVSWACVCRGPWDPCLRLINWVAIN
jgi:hypothetical protein